MWIISGPLVAALETRLGPPIDSYVNGSQTWITPDGPGEVGLEWRLHPVSEFRPPRGLGHEELWDATVGCIAMGAQDSALELGDETRPLTSLWDGLECFPAYGDDLEPGPLGSAATERLGIAPDHSGLVDHNAIGDAWERSNGAVSIVALAVAQLTDG